MWGERPRAFGQRAHVSVGAGAEPTPAWPLPRGGPEAETATPHPEEPWLRGQLPGEACVPEGGPRTAEEGAPEGGGEAWGRECRNEEGAGGARGSSGCTAEICPGPGVRGGQPLGHSPPPQHGLGHHHSQDPPTGPHPEGAGRILGGTTGGGGGLTQILTHSLTHSLIHTHTHKHAQVETCSYTYIHTHTCRRIVRTSVIMALT